MLLVLVVVHSCAKRFPLFYESSSVAESARAGVGKIDANRRAVEMSNPMSGKNDAYRT